MNCKECNAKLKKDDKFCSKCGAKVVIIDPNKCPKCNADVKECSQFCSKCGAELLREDNQEESKVKNPIKTAKKAIVKALDQDGDGKIDIQDIIILAVKTPGVHINRSSFLQKELFKNHPQEVIDKAIATTPAKAGISKEC